MPDKSKPNDTDKTAPTGTSASGFFEIAVRRTVVRRAAFMALVVGNVIGALNHGDKIVMGLMSGTDWIKVGLTFLIPYSVSTISSVMAFRDQERNIAAMKDVAERGSSH